MNLLELQTDAAAFRRALLIDTDAGPHPFAECIEPWQDADFQSLDEGWKRAIIGTSHEAEYQRAWLERPRGHSKSQDIGTMAAWALFASRRQISGYAGAGDLEQARILRDAIGRLLYVNPWLANIIEVQNYKVINHHTGSTLEIISSDAPTSYGLLPDFVICDEACHWKKRDLFDSLLSSAAKRSTCMFVVITNAGMIDDWQWQLREAVRNDVAWYFSRLDGPKASWITADRLAEQERLLPGVAYRRLWLNEWTSGGGDALTEADIEAAFSHGLTPQRSAQPGYEYVAGIDLGVTRDASAICVLGIRRSHRDHGRIRLAATRIWKPTKGDKVDLQQVEDALVELYDRFQFQAINYDPWEARYLASRLQAGGFGKMTNRGDRKAALPMVEITQTGQNLQRIASAVIETFNDHRIECFDDENLRRDLHRLRVEERTYGFRLTSPKDEHGHGDMASAFGLALLAATELASRRMVIAGYPEDEDDGPCTSEFARQRRELNYRQRELANEQRLMKDSYDGPVDPGTVRWGPEHSLF